MEITITEVMQLKPLEGLTFSQALEVACIELADREANFAFWADRRNERAYQNAVRRFETMREVVGVLESANAPQAVKARTRCPHYATIRRTFGFAIAAGLDTKADEAMRAAIGKLLGRDIPSRESLRAGDWERVGDAIKSSQLAW